MATSMGGRAQRRPFAYLLAQRRDWDDAEIHILRIGDTQEAIDATRVHSDALLDGVRVEATVTILVRKPAGSPERVPVIDLIASNSVNADLTLLGMPRPGEGESEAAAERLDWLAQAVGTAELVHNGPDQEELLKGESAC
ncbi:MAG: hypothetical protein AAF624_02310 [Bacteroidota bacterium]